jgi:hypothetical protein
MTYQVKIINQKNSTIFAFHFTLTTVSVHGTFLYYISLMYYSFNDSLKILYWCNNQMDLITQRNKQASPEGPANYVYEILSEIKDI